MARKSAPSIESMPLFATDDMIGALLLGPDRAAEFRQIVPLLEQQRGFPKKDGLMGGRYVPAVRAFWDQQYGLDRGANPPPLAPDGVEDFEAWNNKSKNHRS